MDALRSLRQLSQLRRLRCQEENYRPTIGMPSSGDPNIIRLTRDGVEPVVYAVRCPNFWDYLMCSYGAVVVFVNPEVEDPEDLAIQAAKPFLGETCSFCGKRLDWDGAELIATGEEKDDGEEFQLRIVCRLSTKDRLKRMFGKAVIKHAQIRNIWWLDEDEDDDIPDYLPADWLISPEPVPS